MTQDVPTKAYRVLDQLRGGLIASCQPVDDGPMDRPDIVAAMAQAAIAGGAAGLRIEGVENLRAVRHVVDVPIIGIIKTDSDDTPVRITASVDDVHALIDAGADVVAYDATDRSRPQGRDGVLAAIIAGGALAMADCSTLEDGAHAVRNGAAIIGTTLSGYTRDTERADDTPDFELIRSFAQLSAFVMAEGRVNTPDLAAMAIVAGANAVTVGSALTRLELITEKFCNAIGRAHRQPSLTGFAVDLGGTKTAAARIEDGRIAQYLERATNNSAGPDGQYKQIEDMLHAVGYRRDDPLAVAVTGRVDASGGWHAVNQATLHNISSVPLADDLARRIGKVTVVNDAAATTLAEHRLGAGRGHDNFAFITVSTGVGGGLILGGTLHRSPNGIAGHLGFVSSQRGSALCGSGRIGTVESVASGRAIAQMARDAGHGGVDARAVFEASWAGEPWAKEVLTTSAHAIAELCANLVAMLGVTRIAIGGSVGLADGYLDWVQSDLTTMPELFQADVVPAQLKGDGPLLGGLLFIVEDGSTTD